MKAFPNSFANQLFQKAKAYDLDSLVKSKISSPSEFDFFWSYYYATRSQKSIAFISKAFEKELSGFSNKVEDNFKKAVMGSAAWSMKSHLMSHYYFASDLDKYMDVEDDENILRYLEKIKIQAEMEKAKHNAK